MFFMGACQTSKKAQASYPSKELVGNYWAVKSINGEPIENYQYNRMPYIYFDTTGKFRGNFGCNNFFGSYLPGKKKIHINYAGSTKMLCQDMSAEDAFYTAFKKEIRTYKIEKETLFLYEKGEKGKALLVFTYSDPIPGKN